MSCRLISGEACAAQRSLRSDVGFRASYQWQVGKVVVGPFLKATGSMSSSIRRFRSRLDLPFSLGPLRPLLGQPKATTSGSNWRLPAYGHSGDQALNRFNGRLFRIDIVGDFLAPPQDDNA